MYAGRKPLADADLISLARHRRKQLQAALSAAKEHDESRAAIEREIREIDEAIERGGANLSEAHRAMLMAHAEKNDEG